MAEFTVSFDSEMLVCAVIEKMRDNGDIPMMRCIDCVHYSDYYCGLHCISVRSDDYCSWAEEKKKEKESENNG